MHYPVAPSPAPRPPMPQDVGTARQLWWLVVVFGVVQLVAGLIAAFQQRGDFTDEMLTRMRETDPNIAPATVEFMVLLAFCLAAGVGALVTGLGLMSIHYFGLGKLWARTLLTVAGVWLVLMMFGTLLAFDAVEGIASLVAGGASIVQGVLAGGAVFLSHRRESTAYFVTGRR